GTGASGRPFWRRASRKVLGFEGGRDIVVLVRQDRRHFFLTDVFLESVSNQFDCHATRFVRQRWARLIVQHRARHAFSRALLARLPCPKETSVRRSTRWPTPCQRYRR